MAKISYSDAMERDKILHGLAVYDACNGMMHSFNTKEKYIDMRIKAANFFNRYKRMIQYGEFTFEEIIDDVIQRNAAHRISPKKVNFNSDASVRRMMMEFESRENSREINKMAEETFAMLQNILDSIGGSSATNNVADVKPIDTNNIENTKIQKVKGKSSNGKPRKSRKKDVEM